MTLKHMARQLKRERTPSTEFFFLTEEKKTSTCCCCCAIKCNRGRRLDNNKPPLEGETLLCDDYTSLFLSFSTLDSIAARPLHIKAKAIGITRGIVEVIEAYLCVSALLMMLPALFFLPCTAAAPCHIETNREKEFSCV